MGLAHAEAEERPSAPPACDGEPFPYRVFGVGMNKTGTSSLSRALRHLGVLPVASQRLVQRAGLLEAVFDRRHFEPALRYARMYRAFEDRPWNVWDMYRRLDERYPGSRFVLTVRDPDRWWLSVEHWISVSKPAVAQRYRQHLEARSLSRHAMVEAYLRHNEEIQQHFRGRPDLAVLDFEGGAGWPDLCSFLDLPAPRRRFPHANRQAYDATDTRRRVRRPGGAASDAGVHTTVSLLRCVRCAELLPSSAREAEGLAARLPDWGKAAYRRLQRWHYVPRRREVDHLCSAAALRRRHPGLGLDDMAVVTCFFNPCGYRNRVVNYRRFRRALADCGLPVLTVEMATGDDPFLLGPEDGEVMARRAEHAMWQKERLLNLGIRELLRRGFRKIVWLDADVVFEDTRHWPWHVAVALADHAACQVFGQVVVEQEGGRALLPGVAAVRYQAELGTRLDQERRAPTLRRPFGYPLGYSGFGWAARAEVLAEVELYDRAVVGGGDELIYAASCGLTDGWRQRAESLLRTTVGSCPGCGHVNTAPAMVDDYLAWAERWDRAVGGRAGWTDRTVRSLYHGNRADRRYVKRRDILLRHAFDPRGDLAEGAGGIWRWASPKPDLHLEVQNYFFERREDD